MVAARLRGTCQEAMCFLANPTTGRVSRTDLAGINLICNLAFGKPSLDELPDDHLKAMIYHTLDILDFSRPIPTEYEAQWEDWLNAFLSHKPRLELTALSIEVMIQGTTAKRNAFFS